MMKPRIMFRIIFGAANMSWHLYPYGFGQERRADALPDALTVFVFDEAETPREIAEVWAERFPDRQSSFLTVDIGLPVPEQIEKLATLINWELGSSRSSGCASIEPRPRPSRNFARSSSRSKRLSNATW